MEIQRLSNQYSVRALLPADAEMVYEALRNNTIFYEYHPPMVTVESILEYMEALPPNKGYEDKDYIGFFWNDVLVAVMDLIEHYPQQGTVLLGFFAMNANLQGQGIGTAIISECVEYLAQLGFEKVRLGIDKGNPQSKAFWLKNGFSFTGEEYESNGSTILVMERKLCTYFVETERLALRKVSEEDFSYFRADLADKEMDRMMLRWPCETEEDIRLGFEWFLYKEERAYAIVHKETGETIGNLTVYNHVPECVAAHEAVQGKNGKALSFAVLPAFQRKGYMYEAVSSVIDHLFRVEKADYINCGYLSYNAPSKALQEKLGFTYLLTERFLFDDQEMESIENILWSK